MNQIEILNEALDKYKKVHNWNFKIKEITGHTVILDYGQLELNTILFDKDFLKAVFGEEKQFYNIDDGTRTLMGWQEIGYEIFLSDNRLERFCELYLEYKDK